MTTMASCAEGIVEKIDWDKLGLKRDDFISADASECVVPSILYATVLAYDTTKVKEPPTSISSFLRSGKISGQERPGEEAVRQSRMGPYRRWRGREGCL